MPIGGNYQGSYLTFKSIDGLVFAIDLLVAGKYVMTGRVQCR